MSPTVTVLMPVYNAEKFLAKAIKSILGQTFTDLEFLIINDGSTDDSDKIIKSFTDTRIRYIKFEDNKNLVTCLNHGLGIASGEYIARMDADDIAADTRLEKQVTFLNEHHDMDLVGCQISLIDKKDQHIGELTYSTQPAQIKVDSLFFCPVPHPGVMFRKDRFISSGLFYSSEYKHVEDYELWQRALKKDLRFGNCDEKLLKYRITDDQVSMIHSEEQNRKADEIRQRYLSDINPLFSENEIDVLTNFLNRTLKVEEGVERFQLLLLSLEELVKKNQRLAIFDDGTLKLSIARQLDKLVRFATNKHNKIFRIYTKSPTYTFSHKTFKFKLLMLLKECLA